MAGRANFAVDLETTAESFCIECLGPLGVLPWVLCGMKSGHGRQHFDNELLVAGTHPSSAGVMANASWPNR